MQTFLPKADFLETARILDYRRLGKQRVETLQLLQAMYGLRLISKETVPHRKVDEYYREGELILQMTAGCPVYKRDHPMGFDHIERGVQLYKEVPLPEDRWEVVENDGRGWARHPAALMWGGRSCALAVYGVAMCSEWARRGYKEGTRRKIEFLHSFRCDNREPIMPDWLGDSAFHASHRSNLLHKDPAYYGQFGWEESDDLEYVWPEGSA